MRRSLTTILALAWLSCSGAYTAVAFAPEERAENAILASARLLPFYVDGALYAYVVSELQDGSLLHRLGLRQGDRILSVNGRRISGAFLGADLLQAFSKQPKLELEVESPEFTRRVIRVELKARDGAA